ncbi:hypothetical protein A5791_01435 [Mycobacterium sp. 852002-51163_SCH5372311]|nr:hypothetical protein A5791_01435 [Mycobacterium sp. 852002-51163_SCH5372311]
MTSCPRDVALDEMRKVGAPPARVEEAKSALPDPIDLTRDDDLLGRFGLTRDQLYDRLGASP